MATLCQMASTVLRICDIKLTNSSVSIAKLFQLLSVTLIPSVRVLVSKSVRSKSFPL